MPKFLILFILGTTMVFLNPQIVHSAETIELPIIEDAYAKEYWPTTRTLHYPHLALGKSMLYPEKETVMYFTYDLSSLNKLTLLDVEIEDATLVLHQFQQRTPETYVVTMRGFDGTFNMNSLNWVLRPEITTLGAEQQLYSVGIEKHFNLTEILRDQYTKSYGSGGVEIAMKELNTPGTLFYSRGCTGGTYYQPQCTADMIPKLTVTVDTTPPKPATLNSLESVIILGEEVPLIWGGETQNFYKVQISSTEDFGQLIFESDWTQTDRISHEPIEVGNLYWRVRSVKRLGSTYESVSDIGRIMVTKQKRSPEIPKIIPISPPASNPPQKTETPISNNKKPPTTNTPVPKTDSTKDSEEVKGESTNSEIRTPEDLKKKSDITSQLQNITCSIKTGFWETISTCSKPNLKILSQTRFESENSETVSLEIQLPIEAVITQTYQLCNSFGLKIFSGCKPKTSVKDIDYRYTLSRNDESQRTLSEKLAQGIFEVNSNANNIEPDSKYTLDIVGIIRGTDITFQISNIKLKPETAKIIREQKISKPFSFPFKQNEGVTQWYGKTQFTSFHYGIDFGVVGQYIYSIGDGKIYSTGYDTYNGDCNSGGYYINIEHDNGMHSVYMHLNEKFYKENTLTKGSEVKTGQLIAVSGNSGAFNCEPLRSHLHLETREKAEQQTSKDPVSLISYDWDGVITLESEVYPKRLSGENPHPNY